VSFAFAELRSLPDGRQVKLQIPPSNDFVVAKLALPNHKIRSRKALALLFSEQTPCLTAGRCNYNCLFPSKLGTPSSIIHHPKFKIHNL